MEKNMYQTFHIIIYLHPHTKAFYYHYGRDKKYNKTVLVGATTNSNKLWTLVKIIKLNY